MWGDELFTCAASGFTTVLHDIMAAVTLETIVDIVVLPVRAIKSQIPLCSCYQLSNFLTSPIVLWYEEHLCHLFTSKSTSWSSNKPILNPILAVCRDSLISEAHRPVVLLAKFL